MGRQKGGKNKSWTPEEKLRVVNRYFIDGIGRRLLAREEGLAYGMVSNWIIKYQAEGIEGLINKKKQETDFRLFILANLLPKKKDCVL